MCAPPPSHFGQMMKLHIKQIIFGAESPPPSIPWMTVLWGPWPSPLHCLIFKIMVPYGVHGNFTLKCRGTVENKECGWGIKKLWYYPYYKRNATPTPHEHILGSQRELQSPYLAAPTWGEGMNFGEELDDHMTGWRRKKREGRKEGKIWPYPRI